MYLIMYMMYAEEINKYKERNNYNISVFKLYISGSIFLGTREGLR